jgi:hypothetical protein
MKFTLEIELGNEAMQGSSDVARALRATADRIQGHGHFAGENSAPVRDDNGNTVGSWAVV